MSFGRAFGHNQSGWFAIEACGRRPPQSLLTEKVGTVLMKVQLIVVRGKPEGKVIPLTGSKFKIGRGETCHLRPNSEQVSREHAEFSIAADGVVTVADLGSRNGTLVNGKALTEPCVLKDGNLVQVGPLTFAVQITDAPTPAASRPSPSKPAVQAPAAQAAPAPAPPAPPQPRPAARSAPEDVLNEDIDAWLVGEGAGSGSDVPAQVYGGETITIAAFKDAAEAVPAKPAPVEADEDEEAEEGEAEGDEAVEDSLDEDSEDEEAEEDEDEEEGEAVEEFIDESNPFYAAKKAQKDAEKAAKAGPAATGGANQQFKDTSDAATEILRKLMEKRRASK